MRDYNLSAEWGKLDCYSFFGFFFIYLFSIINTHLFHFLPVSKHLRFKIFENNFHKICAIWIGLSQRDAELKLIHLIFFVKFE
jgi:hypothetical protein